jgi:hypothetical protein
MDILIIVGGERRLVRRAFESHRLKPLGLVHNEAGGSPTIGIVAGVEHLLERPEIPALVLTGPPGPGQVGLPGRIADDLDDPSVLFLDLEPEEEARFAERPGASPCP